MQSVKLAHGKVQLLQVLLLSDILYKMVYHNFCSDERVRLQTMENAPCAKEQKKQLARREEIRVAMRRCTSLIERERLLKQLGKEITILSHKSEKSLIFLNNFLSSDKVLTKMEHIAPNIHTSLNESFHNVFNIYRDKTKHYTHYNTRYELAYLDINKNRGRQVHWKYKTVVRERKKNHKKRYNRTIPTPKTFY